MFVYLHSQQHSDTTFFCTETLCAPAVLGLLRTNYVVYGADIWSKAGYDLTVKLGAEAYPYVAIVFPGRDASTALKGFPVSTLNGYCDASTMAANLTRFATSHEIESLWAGAAREVRRRQEVLQEQQLRTEQEQAYQESLRADIERENRLEAERQQKKAEEEAKRLEKEERRRKKEERKQEALCMREVRRAAVTPEPPAGSKEATMIAIRLPQGRKAVRRFLVTDTLASAFGFADKEMGELAPLNFALCTNVPRRTFTWDKDRDTAIGSLGKQLLMLVQEIHNDDDDDDDDDDEEEGNSNEEEGNDDSDDDDEEKGESED